MADPLSDGIIDRWADEAIDDLSKKSWRELEPNSMMLIIYAIQKNRYKKLVSKITSPFWWLGGVAGAGLVWWIICSIFGIG